MTDDIALAAIAAILGLYYFYLEKYDAMSDSQKKTYAGVVGLVVLTIFFIGLP